MGRQNISRKAWQRAVNVLLWYPDNVAEYNALREELTTRDPEHEGSGSKSIHHDPTADTAARLADNPRLRNLEAEIIAVELSVAKLRPEQAEVIRRRFWDGRYNKGRRKPRQYDYLQDLHYSLDGMRKIVRSVIVDVAVRLGER